MRRRRAVLLFLSSNLMICGSFSAFAQEEGTTLGPKQMPGYCHKMAVEMYGVKPNKVKVRKAVQETNSFTVTGTADQGASGKRTFHCAFDTEGKFTEMVVEATNVE